MINNLFDFDKSFGKQIIGTDEAGRGPASGGVFAAAVAFAEEPSKDLLKSLEKLNDSKKLSKKNREELYDFIKNDVNLQKALNEYSTKVYREVERLFPAYLHKQIEFIVSAFTNTERSLVINHAYNQGLLSLDEDNKYFVYNMLIYILYKYVH